MSWHSVPYRTWLQFSQTHLELVSTTTLNFAQYRAYNQLVYNTVVAIFHLSVCIRLCNGILLRISLLVCSNQLSNIFLVSRSRVDVELSRISRVVALESYFFLATAYIKTFFKLHRIFLAINGNNPVATYVDNTQFTSVEEMFSLQFIKSFQLQHLVYWHGTTKNQTIVQCISYIDFVWSHHFFHQERFTQTFSIVMFYILRVASSLNFVVHLGVSRECGKSHHHCNS